MDERRPGCPKRMVHGPCGGVQPDGRCEVALAGPCVFVDRPSPPPVPRRPAARPGFFARAGGQAVVTDLHVRPRDTGSLREVARALRGTCDAVLVADHGARRGDFPPIYVASQLVAMGIRPWVTLSCRDRNRAALSAECAALADMGVAGVHAVTGDWGTGGESQVFDLDGLRLAELAASYGLEVSVAAAPAAPPVGARPARLAAKAGAGATSCFVNHCGGPAVVARFVAAARDAGADMDFIPCIPVISDPASAALADLPGLILDPEVVEEVRRAGGDPGAGVRMAAAVAAAMLAVPGVVGVNLSGAASTRSEAESAVMMAGLGSLIKETIT